MESLIYQLLKDVSKLIGRILRFFLTASGASVSSSVGAPRVQSSRKLYPVKLTLSPGTLSSEFNCLTTNGVLYTLEKENTEEYFGVKKVGERLPNPYFLNLTIRPEDKPTVLNFFIEPVKDGPTEIIFSGRSFEKLYWRQSLQP